MAAAKYRIVYGETIPAWTKHCATMKEVHQWVSRCMALGDVIFTIEEMKGQRRGLPAIIDEAMKQ